MMHLSLIVHWHRQQPGIIMNVPFVGVKELCHQAFEASGEFVVGL